MNYFWNHILDFFELLRHNLSHYHLPPLLVFRLVDLCPLMVADPQTFILGVVAVVDYVQYYLEVGKGHGAASFRHLLK